MTKRIGIAQTHYSRIEKGMGGASQETLQAIIQALNISISDIWDDGNIPSPIDAIDLQTPGIVIEHGTGKNKKRYILPPTQESYNLIESQMKDSETDPRLQTIITLWDALDESIKDAIAAILSDGEQGK